LALLPGGRLQVLSFAGTGASLILLAAALPRGARSALLATCGAGLLAATFPLDRPDGDPGELASWIRSWHAVVHAGGFVVSGAAGILAIGVSGKREDVAVAGLLAAAAVAGRTPGWYLFVTGFFTWVSRLAGRVARDELPPRGARQRAARRRLRQLGHSVRIRDCTPGRMASSLLTLAPTTRRDA
jgi:hypothetical protein